MHAPEFLPDVHVYNKELLARSHGDRGSKGSSDNSEGHYSVGAVEATNELILPYDEKIRRSSSGVVDIDPILREPENQTVVVHSVNADEYDYSVNHQSLDEQDQIQGSLDAGNEVMGH